MDFSPLHKKILRLFIAMLIIGVFSCTTVLASSSPSIKSKTSWSSQSEWLGDGEAAWKDSSPSTWLNWLNYGINYGYTTNSSPIVAQYNQAVNYGYNGTVQDFGTDVKKYFGGDTSSFINAYKEIQRLVSSPSPLGVSYDIDKEMVFALYQSSQYDMDTVKNYVQKQKDKVNKAYSSSMAEKEKSSSSIKAMLEAQNEKWKQQQQSSSKKTTSASTTPSTAYRGPSTVHTSSGSGSVGTVNLGIITVGGTLTGSQNPWDSLKDNTLLGNIAPVNSLVALLQNFGIWICTLSIMASIAGLVFFASPGKREEHKGNITYKLLLIFLLAGLVVILGIIKSIAFKVAGF